MDAKEWNRFAAEFQSRLNGEGMFLTAQAEGRINTMTISWGSAGVYWGTPVITAPVRFSRFTKGLIDRSGYFTVSIPKKGELSKELAFCGTKSGRDVDKFPACGFTARPGRSVPAPVIGQAWMHIECRVLCKYDTGSGNFEPETERRFYSDKNFHTFYLGAVMDFYEL